MRLFATTEMALPHDQALSFPDPGSARGSAGIIKRPYIGEHLPGHPGEREDLDPCPIAYLVKQEADCTIHPHFHRIAQFQVFVGGSGRFGQRAIDGCQVHFANAWSTYGPIVAGPEGVDYLVLRMRYAKGAGWMPAAREQLLQVPNRQPRNVVYPAFKIDTKRPERITLGDESDGLGAWYVALADGASTIDPDPSSGGGQFTVALRGTLRNQDGVVLPALAVHFNTNDEPPMPWSACNGPASLLQVRFPKIG